jgi:hypothetical protein
VKLGVRPCQAVWLLPTSWKCDKAMCRCQTAQVVSWLMHAENCKSLRILPQPKFQMLENRWLAQQRPTVNFR